MRTMSWGTSRCPLQMQSVSRCRAVDELNRGAHLPFLAEGGAYGQRVFTKLFTEEIKDSLQVTERWAKRTPPTPLDLNALLADPTSKGAGSRVALDQQVLPVGAYARMLIDTITEIVTTRKADIGNLVFDKDDSLSMDFVCRFVWVIVVPNSSQLTWLQCCQLANGCVWDTAGITFLCERHCWQHCARHCYYQRYRSGADRTRRHQGPGQAPRRV